MFAVDQGGRLAAYCDVRADDDGRLFPVDVRVDPDAWGAGLAEALLEAAEGWARQRAQAGALVRGFPGERDAELRGALVGRGYTPVRHSFHMEIDLADVPEAPDRPSGITLRTYEPDRDEQAVYEAHQEAFADHWDFRPVPIELWRTYQIERPRFDPSLWWLAEEDGELAGVCLNAWHFSGDPGFGWIGDLAVRRRWRRRGLGLALLRHSFADFERRGATRVGLGVDAENPTGALRLYERAGMRPVRRTDTYERTL
jgi:mycothiol synthase